MLRAPSAARTGAISSDDARDIARELARLGHVEITQKGDVLDPDATWRGPIRIRAR